MSPIAEMLDSALATFTCISCLSFLAYVSIIHGFLLIFQPKVQFQGMIESIVFNACQTFKTWGDFFSSGGGGGGIWDANWQ